MDRFPWKSQPKFPPEVKSDTSSEDGQTENETDEENSNDSDQNHHVEEESHRQKRNSKSFMISKVRNSVSSDHDPDNQSSVFAASTAKKTSESSKSSKKNEQEKESTQNFNDKKPKHKNPNERGSKNKDPVTHQEEKSEPEEKRQQSQQHRRIAEKQKSSSTSKKEEEKISNNNKKSKKSDLLPKLLNSLNDSIAAENQEHNRIGTQEHKQQQKQRQSTVEKRTKGAENWSPSKPLPAEPQKSTKKMIHCGGKPKIKFKYSCKANLKRFHVIPQGCRFIHFSVGTDQENKKKLLQKEKLTYADTCKIIKWKPFCCVDNEIRRLCWHLGEFISKHLLVFFLVTTIICSLSGLGALLKRQNLAITAPFEYFKPPCKPKSPDAANIDSIFNSTNKRYDSIRRRSSSDFAFIFKSTSDDGNLLREDVIEDYVNLKRAVDEIKVVDHSNKLYKYSTLCRGQDSLLTASSSCNFNLVEAAMAGARSVKFRYPEMDVSALLNVTSLTSGTDKDSAKIFSADIFGGVETDLDGSIARSQALAAHFKLLEIQNDLTSSSSIGDQDQQTSTTLELKNLLNQWDTEFQKLMIKESDKSKLYKLYFWSRMAFESTVAETFRLLYVYSSIMIGILIVCSILIMAKIFGCRKVTVWSSMGPVSTIMATFTVIGSLSLAIGLNGYFNSAILPAMIVIAACSIFLSTTALQTWRKYNAVVVNPAEKLKFVFCWQNSSTLQICLIVGLTFLVCSKFLDLPLLKTVCYTVASATVLLAVWTSMLIALLYKCEDKELSDSIKLLDLDEKVLDKLSTPILRNYNLSDVEALHHKFLDKHRCLSRKIGLISAKVHLRYLSCLIFISYLILASWGCTLLTVNLNEKQFLRSSTTSGNLKISQQNSNLLSFLSNYDRFFAQHDNYIQLIFDEPIDYFNTQTRSALMDILTHLQFEQRYAEKVTSWLKDFAQFEQSSIYLVNRDTFVPVVDLIFLRDDRYKKFSADIALGKYNEQIVASKMYIELNKLGSTHLLDIVKYLRGQAKTYNLPLVVKTPGMFMMEHDLTIQMDTVIVVLVAAFASAGISFLFFGQPLTSAVCCFTILSSSAGTLGFGAIWGVPLNAPNLAVLLAGLAFTCLLTLSYSALYHSVVNGRESDRTVYAFQTLVDGFFWSCVFLSTAPLPFLFLVDCDFVTHLCKLCFLHSMGTLLHVSLFLPSLLILCTTHLCRMCSKLCNLCQETCCCCDADEDAESIYYLPTSGQPVDPNYVEQFFRLKFREDIHAVQQHPLPAPPNRPMIMGPPNQKVMQQLARRVSQRDMVGQAAPVRASHYYEQGPPPVAYQRQPIQPPPDLIRPSSQIESLDDSCTSAVDDQCPRQIVEHVDSEDGSEQQPVVEVPRGGAPKTPKICYAKWTKEIPVDAYTTERVIAEKYTIEGDDGSKFDLPPDWKRFWIKGNLKQGAPVPSVVPQPCPAPHFDHQAAPHFRERRPEPSSYAYKNRPQAQPNFGPSVQHDYGPRPPPVHRVYEGDAPGYYPNHHASPPMYKVDRGHSKAKIHRSRSNRGAAYY